MLLRLFKKALTLTGVGAFFYNNAQVCADMRQYTCLTLIAMLVLIHPRHVVSTTIPPI